MAGKKIISEGMFDEIGSLLHDKIRRGAGYTGKNERTFEDIKRQEAEHDVDTMAILKNLERDRKKKKKLTKSKRKKKDCGCK